MPEKRRPINWRVTSDSLLLRPEFARGAQKRRAEAPRADSRLGIPLRQEYVEARRRSEASAAKPRRLIMADGPPRGAATAPALQYTRGQVWTESPYTLRRGIHDGISSGLLFFGDSERDAYKTAEKINGLLDFPLGPLHAIEGAFRKAKAGNFTLDDLDKVALAVVPGGKKADDVARLLGSKIAVETAPKLPGALGSQISQRSSNVKRAKLQTDSASRMDRADAQGYRREPYYHVDLRKRVPVEYEDIEVFTRDKKQAKMMARRAGKKVREFRLNPQRPLTLNSPYNLQDRVDVINALDAAGDEKAALRLAQATDIKGDRSPSALVAAAKEYPDLELGYGQDLFDEIAHHADGSEMLALRRAGFDSVDRGEDMVMLTGEGIRLKKAKFAPDLAHLRNIHYALPPLTVGMIGVYPSQSNETSGSK